MWCSIAIIIIINILLLLHPFNSLFSQQKGKPFWILLKQEMIVGVGILRNKESCQRVICKKSSAERSANYPLSLFHMPQRKNSAFLRIAKLRFARIVQQMCSRCIAASGIPRCLPSIFFVVCLPKNRVVFFTISTNFKISSTFQVSHHFAGRCDWLQSV